MIASHAPGPWTVRNRTVSFIDHGKRYAIARVSNSPLITGESHEANARLIAAAPDLLAALIAFRDEGAGFVGWHPNYERAIELAQSAIAAAVTDG